MSKDLTGWLGLALIGISVVAIFTSLLSSTVKMFFTSIAVAVVCLAIITLLVFNL